ncbi:MAG: ATP synthase subunit I [Syntrophales bacterium]|nr:ATP synthase subunit I [Syntrophales bacterium]
MFASVNFTLGILTGGLISTLNFYGLCRGLETAFGQMENGGKGKKAAMFKYLLKLVVTGLVLYLVLAKTTADIFGLVIGLSTVVIGIVFTVIMTQIDKNYLEEV